MTEKWKTCETEKSVILQIFYKNSKNQIKLSLLCIGMEKQSEFI